ncbi:MULTISPECIES: hypothetical protein [unclassified Providencia]|uniref:hypothetical protein n=1 Tax=unclassified Providencia TaxID=2633465 RepID=UPI002349730A|nr:MULTISPECIES: hypothetical protein [unclassified Providencia]
MISEAELMPISPENYCLSLLVTSLGEWALSLFSHVDEIKKAVENDYFGLLFWLILGI